MKKIILSALSTAVAAGMFATKPALTDQVLMIVDGKDVKVGEFEYLFNKNNSQQLKPQSIDDYIDMFVDYKLKVADAEHAGIDTTAAFLAEFGKFRDELAAPYLRDNKVEEDLLKESYAHFGKDVLTRHIMLTYDKTIVGREKAKRELNKIRKSIIDGEITFEEAAKKYSVDTPTAVKGGFMGWVTAGRFPWPFEKAAYDTAKGKISPVIDSGFGLHLIKVEDIRPSRGEVNAAHILKLTRNVSEDMLSVQKAAIDSIYEVLVGGADFAAVAQSESQDPGSAADGGDLGWFGSGVMVAEFDSVAFALADGEISKPFATSFGYHIIKKNGHRGVLPFEEMRGRLLRMMQRDDRANMPYKARMGQLAHKYGVTEMKANAMTLRHRVGMLPVLDSLTWSNLTVDSMELVRLADGKITVADAIAALGTSSYKTPYEAAEAIIAQANEMMERYITDRAITDLVVEDADYRNLVNEYRDGILLFDISNRNVWDRAVKDKDGLENYFKANVLKYTWNKPHFKSYIIFAANDSIVDAAVSYADSVAIADPEAFVAEMRNHFGKILKIERVIAAQGDNQITDYLAFGGEKPKAQSPKWAAYRAYKGRVIAAPEEAADVRGAATADYQTLLEQEWLKKLRKTYKVKINKKVLKQFKAAQEK